MTGINSQWQWWYNGELAGRFVTDWWLVRVRRGMLSCVEQCVIYQHCHMAKFCNKCKFVPVCDMKAYWRNRSVAPLTLNLGMRCKWTLNFMPQLLLTPLKDPLIPTE